MITHVGAYVCLPVCAHVCNRRKKEDGKKRWSGQSVIEGRMPFPSLVGMLPEPARGGRSHTWVSCAGKAALQSAHFRRALPRAQSQASSGRHQVWDSGPQADPTLMPRVPA